MQKQTFVVTLEIIPPFDQYSPRIEAERMANIIRHGVETKSCSFVGAVPFRITVARVGEIATARGKMQEYPSQEVESLEEAA